MIYKTPFILASDELNLIDKVKNEFVSTNWAAQGKMAEKGETTEARVTDIISLFDNIYVAHRSKKRSVLDEVLKVDIVLKDSSQPWKAYAFQIKSSLTGAIEHYSKYGDEIEYQEHYFRTPWCLILDGTESALDIFHEIANKLSLIYNELDFEKLDEIAEQVNSSNGKRISHKDLNLTERDFTALRLFYNISRFKSTIFYNSSL